MNFLSLANVIKLKNMLMFSRPEADYRKAQTFSGNANERNARIMSKSTPAKFTISTHKKKKERKCTFDLGCTPTPVLIYSR